MKASKGGKKTGARDVVACVWQLRAVQVCGSEDVHLQRPGFLLRESVSFVRSKKETWAAGSHRFVYNIGACDSGASKAF